MKLSLHKVLVLLFPITLLCTIDQEEHVLKKQRPTVTFKLNGGRLGDNLLNFIKSLWFSYVYDGDFMVMPFKYYDQLALSRMYPSWDEALFQDFSTILLTTNDAGMSNRKAETTLYQTTFRFCSSLWGDLSDCTLWHGLFDNDTFRQMIRNCLAPIDPIPAVFLPHTMPTVALHVRKGGGYDAPLLSKELYADVKWPLRFVPDAYYIEQLCYLSDVLDNVPLYVHLFTDDPNPEELVEKYTQNIDGRPITFGYRSEVNSHTINVLEDLYAIAQCDYLIRPESSYSKTAHLLGKHKMVISPASFAWKNKQLMITEVVVMEGEKRSIRPTSLFQKASEES